MPIDIPKSSSPARRAALRRWLRRWRALIASTVLSLGFIGLLYYIGYFGGPVFATVSPPAHSRSPVPGLTAVVLSGDTGFHFGLSPRVAERIAEQGIPVIGVNSLSYFGTRRSLPETEALVREATRRALAVPGTSRVALIGQSFGADMLQAGLPGLPPELRSRVLLVALIVPGDTLNFRASIPELLDFEAPDRTALPTARLLDWVPAVCIHGAIEEHSLCPLLTQPNVSQVELPGGHMLNRNAEGVAAVILRAMVCAARPGERRTGTPCQPIGNPR